MAKKETVFTNESMSIIESLVKKYNLVLQTGQEDEIMTRDLLAVSEIAQTIKDIVMGRYSIDNCPSKFQKIFNISKEMANNIIKELEDAIISKAEMISVEQNKPLSSLKNIPTDEKKQEQINKSPEQDSYRELIK